MRLTRHISQAFSIWHEDADPVEVRCLRCGFYWYRGDWRTHIDFMAEHAGCEWTESEATRS